MLAVKYMHHYHNFRMDKKRVIWLSKRHENTERNTNAVPLAGSVLQKVKTWN
jgi:hypothetical protein